MIADSKKYLHQDKLSDKEWQEKIVIEIFYLESTLKKFLFSFYGKNIIAKFANILKNLENEWFIENKPKVKKRLWKILSFLINKRIKKWNTDYDLIDFLNWTTLIEILDVTNFKKEKGINIVTGKLISDLRTIKEIRNDLCHPSRNSEIDLEKFLEKRSINKDDFSSRERIVKKIFQINKDFDLLLQKMENKKLLNKNY